MYYSGDGRSGTPSAREAALVSGELSAVVASGSVSRWRCEGSECVHEPSTPAPLPLHSAHSGSPRRDVDMMET